MPRKKPTKKSNKKNPKISLRKTGFSAKEMRFRISLVILIGMLALSVLLLLFTLNKFSSVQAGTGKIPSKLIVPKSNLQKSKSRILEDDTLDFKMTIPKELGKWFYRIGEVESLTDDLLSNQYLQIFVPVPGVSSNDFDRQNKNILTIRRFTSDEWSDIKTACRKEKQDICDAGGKMIAETIDADSDDNWWVYTYTKPSNCPKNIEAKCNLTDKIIQSFQLK